MDFTLDEEQSAVAELAGKILTDLCAADALRAHEGAGGGVLAAAWSALAQADLLGLALPGSAGGGGYGVLEASLVAEQVGRHVAPVPYVATTTAALALAESDPAAHAGLLGGVARGGVILATAVDDTAGLVTASYRNGGTVTLTGDAHFVPWAPVADGFVVAASTEAGEGGLYLVRPGDGVGVVAEDAVWGLPQGSLELSAAPAIELGDGEAVERAALMATALNCATVAGLCGGATRITAAYVSEREQFGAPIGTFQAVAQRMADSYIDTQGVQLTARQAAWRLAEGLPSAEAVHIAKYWAAAGGHRVAHAAQHLHGGIGLDIEYPIHRYFRWIKVLELQLGSGIEHLRRLGAIIATVPA
jgi:3-oxocholest-4-en-26-oyl-CoA dehydrogenase beta subunit